MSKMGRHARMWEPNVQHSGNNTPRFLTNFTMQADYAAIEQRLLGMTEEQSQVAYEQLGKHYAEIGDLHGAVCEMLFSDARNTPAIIGRSRRSVSGPLPQYGIADQDKR